MGNLNIRVPGLWEAIFVFEVGEVWGWFGGIGGVCGEMGGG